MNNSRGYLCIAQNSGDLDYIRMAYALALSVKASQSTVSDFAIAVVDKREIPEHYKHAFDHIVEIPWSDHAKDDQWKINNKWKYFYMTPFDETVILDTDMIFTSDVSHWWDYLSTKDVWATTNIQTFRGEVVTSNHYRKTFASNNLPNIYTAFFYFKKSELAAELFKMNEIIFNNWERFYYDYLDETRPKHLSADVVYALSIKILGIENECTAHHITSMPTFVHMKSFIQNIPEQFLTEDWTQHIPSYFTEECQLKVGNFQQLSPFHYHVKSWLTNDIIRRLEQKVLYVN